VQEDERRALAGPPVGDPEPPDDDMVDGAPDQPDEAPAAAEATRLRAGREMPSSVR